MIEVCKKVAELHGWDAGFLRADNSGDFAELLADGQSRLIVLDYAETRSDLVVSLVRETLRARLIGKVRFVLLARDGGDWWNRLADKAHGDKALEAILNSPSSKKARTGWPKRRSNPRRAKVCSRKRWQVLPSFAACLADERATRSATERFGQVLYIHLAALAALRGEVQPGNDELLAVTLGHERAYWRKLMQAHDFDAQRMRDAFEQCLALITLAGGGRSAAAIRALIGRTPRLRGLTPEQQDRLFDLLRHLYSWEGGVRGLQPDRCSASNSSPKVCRAMMSRSNVILGRDGTREQARHAFTILTRLAGRDPTQEVWLKRALDRYLGSREREALDVAKETGSPLPELIKEAIKAAPKATRKHVVNTLRPEIPKETKTLRELAIEIGQQRVVFAREKGVNTRKSARQMFEALEFLGLQLRAAGRHGEAVQVLRKGVNYARTWEKSPSPADRAAGLARAHVNFAVSLSELGRFDEALEKAVQAEEIYRELAERQADAYRADWALSLGNLAKLLSDLGRFDEALEKAVQAEEIYRELALRQPDAHRADWALPIGNLAKLLSELGRFDEALEKAVQAEEIYRELAERQADAYRADWARSLGNLAGFLSELGRFDEALEKAVQAEEIYRELALRQPDAYRADWARSLGNLAGVLSELGNLAGIRLSDPRPLRRCAGEGRTGRRNPPRAGASPAGRLSCRLGAFAWQPRDSPLEARPLRRGAGEGRTGRRNLPRAGPSPAGSLSCQVALSLANLAESNLRVGRAGDAEKAADHAVKVLEPLGEAYPTNGVCIWGLPGVLSPRLGLRLGT